MGRVHREIFERFKRAHVAGNRSSSLVLKELRVHNASGQKAGTAGRFTYKMKHILLSMAAYSPCAGHTGMHISEVLQVPDLMDIILRDVECKRHALRVDEAPKLKILGLRYGVSETAIRKCNDLDDRSKPIGTICVCVWCVAPLCRLNS